MAKSRAKRRASRASAAAAAAPAVVVATATTTAVAVEDKGKANVNDKAVKDKAVKDEEVEDKEVKDKEVKDKEVNDKAVNDKAVTSAAKEPKEVKEKGSDHGGQYCSLCWGESYEGAAKIDDMPLCKCRECNTLYHNECYRNYSIFAKECKGAAHGMERVVVDVDPTADNNNKDSSNYIMMDTCMACASVGTTVKGRTRRGKHHTIEVKTRPYECCLCSVDSPELPLPMHPIYDRNNGRQLVLDEGGGGAGAGLRLAWCHTLCARVVGSSPATGGCVYSCDPRGEYGGMAEDDDDRSISSEIETARKNKRITKDKEYGVHHYCIVLQPGWKAYIKAIKTAQKFECIQCGKGGKNGNLPYRIPVACVCCEDTEPDNYSNCHSKKDREKECLNAMHVGCAMWGSRINGVQSYPNARRMHFEPNTAGGDDFFVMYCDQHANNIKNNGGKHNVNGYDWLRYPEESGIISAKSTTRKEATRITNKKDTIESDDDKDYDDDKNADDDDDADDDKELEKGETGKRKRKNDADHDEGKRRGKHGPRKEETARDRLERKMSRQQKKGAGAGTLTSHGGPSRHQSAAASAATKDDPLAQISVPRKSNTSTVAAAPAALPEPPKEKPKRKLDALKLGGLLKGEKVDWNPRKPSPEHAKKSVKPLANNKIEEKFETSPQGAAIVVPAVEKRTTDPSPEIPIVATEPEKGPDLSPEIPIVSTAAKKQAEPPSETAIDVTASAKETEPSPETAIDVTAADAVADAVADTVADAVADAVMVTVARAYSYPMINNSSTSRAGLNDELMTADIADIEMMATTLDPSPKIVAGNATVTLTKEHDDESLIDWGHDDETAVAAIIYSPTPKDDSLPPWQSDEANMSFEYSLPGDNSNDKPATPVVPDNISIPQHTSVVDNNLHEHENASVEEGEVLDTEKDAFTEPTATGPIVNTEPSANEPTADVPIAASMPETAQQLSAEPATLMHPATNSTSRYPANHNSTGPLPPEVVAFADQMTISGIEKDKSDRFFALIMDEITLKQRYRAERNGIETILDSVELHWQAELTRCGIVDAEAFFQVLRSHARAECSERAESDDTDDSPRRLGIKLYHN